MKAVHRGFTSGVLSCLFLAGCAAWSSAPQFSQPYFVVDAGEVKSLHALAKKQEALVPKCAEHNSCDHVYFTRALLGLYESRDNASKYFEKVLAVAPKSQLASSSQLWLQLLEYHAAPVEQSWFQSVMAAPAISESQVILAQASDRLVRDLLDRELTIQQLRAMKDADSQSLENLQRDLAERERKMDTVNGKKDTARGSTDTGIVLSLQKQVTDRDRKIEELTSQLEALKRIDQEMRDKARPIRPPSTVAPPPTAPEPTTP
jgi:Skp family chaperone for outer membrane proteins